MAYDNDQSFLGTGEKPLTVPTDDEKTVAMLSHILTVVPGVGILAPLIIYVLKNQSSTFVAYHSRESLNFQITIFLLYILAILLVILFIGIVMFWIIGIVNVVLAIVATIRASEKKLYRYPFNIRLIK
jgi:uncharacterized Tic20 family protein